MSGVLRVARWVGIAVLALLAALALGWLARAGAWLAWRCAAAAVRAGRVHPVVSALLLVLAAGLAVRRRRRRALRRSGEAGLLVLHRLWANLDAVSGMLLPAAGSAGQPPATLLPLLADLPVRGLAPDLRERLARTDALLGQLHGLLPGSAAPRAGWAGRGDLQLRQAIVRDVMQAMLEDFAIVAAVALPSAVSTIAGAQEQLRQARARQRPVETRITASQAYREGAEGALLLCWRHDQAPPGADVVALGG